jgi:acetate kinase
MIRNPRWKLVHHGGSKYWGPQRITPAMVDELHQLSPFGPEHRPEEILLTEAFHRRFPDLPQIACFDTAFHHNMPRMARWLPIPRRYDARGVRVRAFRGYPVPISWKNSPAWQALKPHQAA